MRRLPVGFPLGSRLGLRLGSPLRSFPRGEPGRRSSAMATAILLLALVCLSLSGLARAGVLEIRSFVRTVSDIDRATAFYESALEFKRIADRIIVNQDYAALTGVQASKVRSVTLQLGGETIELEQPLGGDGEPVAVEGRSQDLWFQHMAIVVADMQRAYRQVTNHGARPISAEPQTIPESNKAAAGIKAYKFRDPDGHPLELLSFPPDKGAPKWHEAARRAGTNFLGIDHSAITVGDTARSLAFYEELLGLIKAGASLNQGVTQERLDAAPGAVVRITGLATRRMHGPGLEFLQYLAPADGRAWPDGRNPGLNPGPNPTAALSTRTVFEVADIDALVPKLAERKVQFISPRVVTMLDAPYRKALVVLDPDGHPVMLVQR